MTNCKHLWVFFSVVILAWLCVAAWPVSSRTDFAPPSAQLKFFPSSQEPPEETLELWLNGERLRANGPGGLEQVLGKLYCLLNASNHAKDFGRNIVDVMACLNGQSCPDLEQVTDLLKECQSGGCGDLCAREEDLRGWAECVHDCSRRDNTEPWRQEAGRQRNAVTQKRAETLLSAVKRYRMSLYDCISSYCASYQGEDRKSCIVYYCHRSRAGE